jgi:acyl carrier protein phosphodiesterase
MNFLVHQFILNNDLESRQGNYLGDFIKGLESILNKGVFPVGIFLSYGMNYSLFRPFIVNEVNILLS